MKKKKKLQNVKRTALIIGCIMLFLCIIGCTNQESKNPQVATSAPTPDFLMMVAPTSINQEDYEKSFGAAFTMARGIIIQINGDKIGLAPENRDIEVVRQRASLFIAGQQISQDTLEIADGIEGLGGPYYLSWTPELTPGVYDAKFQFLTDSGEVLEYRWQIIIEE